MPIVVAFLQGRQVPVVEFFGFDADPNVFAATWRVYLIMAVRLATFVRLTNPRASELGWARRVLATGRSCPALSLVWHRRVRLSFAVANITTVTTLAKKLAPANRKWKDGK